jgi:RNA-binding protein
MSELTAKQRAYLRGLAHPLKALIHVGKEGVTAEAVTTLEQALAHRELIKVRVLENAPAGPAQSARELAAGVAGTTVVQVIGRVAVLYRPHPERPEIRPPHPRKQAR